nr:RES family NAD+ phosphorylase [Endozoicomonas sp. ONNA2]
MGYVDTLDEQALLEELLEEVKPPFQQTSRDDLHYLLKTPFRYPPLDWGSRFGRRDEPSIFYGGCGIDVTLAEAAYYRFVFWDSMDMPPPKEMLISQHSMFSVGYQTARGVKLHKPPFITGQSELTSIHNYATCQILGTDMRAAGVEAFEYTSARDPDDGTCVGLFSAEPFVHKDPQQQTKWLCEVTAKKVQFKSINSPLVKTFPVDIFLLDGSIPLPA